jgi:small-conductance mechanosensitive channel
VEAIDYVTTVIRREDNSLVNVPNHVFTHGEIINWSRTPYRLLRLQVTLDDLLALPGVISALKDKIASIDGVESKQRSVVVSATGFKDAKNVIIEISCHLAASSEEEAGDLKTQVVRVVSAVLDEEKKKARPAL